MYQKTVIFLSIVGVFLSLILGALSIIAWQIVAVLIAVSIGIPSLILTYEKLKPEVSVKPKEVKREQEQKKGSVTGFVTDLIMKEKDFLRKETIVVSPTNGYSYEFDLSRGDHLEGEIISTSPIDIYFVDNINFDKWDRDKYFDPEDCNEGVLETSIDYFVPKTGTWYLVIENNGRKSATVKISLH